MWPALLLPIARRTADLDGHAAAHAAKPIVDSVGAADQAVSDAGGDAHVPRHPDDHLALRLGHEEILMEDHTQIRRRHRLHDVAVTKSSEGGMSVHERDVAVVIEEIRDV